MSFLRNGKTVVTVPRTLKTNDDEVTQDGIVTEATGTGTSTLKEIRFGRQKEAVCRVYNAVWTSIYHGGLIGLFAESGSCIRRDGSSSERSLHGNLCVHSLNASCGHAPLEMEGYANVGKHC
jgi:hypothetical protein